MAEIVGADAIEQPSRCPQASLKTALEITRQAPGRTTLLTGGNGGVGLQCARSILQASGWEMVVAGRPCEKTERAKAVVLRHASLALTWQDIPQGVNADHHPTAAGRLRTENRGV
jgi:hypothetical protein